MFYLYLSIYTDNSACTYTVLMFVIEKQTVEESVQWTD